MILIILLNSLGGRPSSSWRAARSFLPALSIMVLPAHPNPVLIILATIIIIIIIMLIALVVIVGRPLIWYKLNICLWLQIPISALSFKAVLLLPQMNNWANFTISIKFWEKHRKSTKLPWHHNINYPSVLCLFVFLSLKCLKGLKSLKPLFVSKF